MSKNTYLLSLNSSSQLKNYISNTLNNISHITYDSSSRNVDIYFSSYLTSEQKITLDSLIENYPNYEEVNTSVLKRESHAIPNININTSTYTIITSLIYEGSSDKILNNFFFSSYKNTLQQFTYSVRLWDSTNKLVIYEITGLNNNLHEITECSNLSNIPTSVSLLELQCKLSNYDRYGVLFTSLIIGYL